MPQQLVGLTASFGFDAALMDALDSNVGRKQRWTTRTDAIKEAIAFCMNSDMDDLRRTPPFPNPTGQRVSSGIVLMTEENRWIMAHTGLGQPFASRSHAIECITYWFLHHEGLIGDQATTHGAGPTQPPRGERWPPHSEPGHPRQDDDRAYPLRGSVF